MLGLDLVAVRRDADLQRLHFSAPGHFCAQGACFLEMDHSDAHLRDASQATQGADSDRTHSQLAGTGPNPKRRARLSAKPRAECRANPDARLDAE